MFLYSVRDNHGVLGTPNALDKIDETIKGESPSALSVDVDDDMNLIVKLTNGDGSELEDSASLMAISGVLVVQDELATATMIITKTASNQQVYNGAVTSQSIPVGAGSVKVVITQFGNTLEKDIQVSGETLLDLSADIVTVTPKSSAVSWAINNVSIPSVGTIKVIKGITESVKLVFGNWSDGTEIEYTQNSTFNSNTTISPSYSNPKLITQSGNFIVPKSAQYEIVLTGGGGGGCGGERGGSNGGAGGNGGDGGYIFAVRTNLTLNQSIPVTIGTGGAGGAGRASNTATGVGEQGGTTIFGSYQAEGGAGAPVRNQGSNHGGEGGDGSNGKNMSIFGQSKSYGEGAGWGYSNSSVAEGGVGDSGITWLNQVGDGGDSGRKGYSNTSGGSGGQGGNGFYYNKAYGRGGQGGNGGRGSSTSSQRGDGYNGGSGYNGAVAIRVAV